MERAAILPESELVTRARGGDKAAFEELVRLFLRPIRYYLAARLRECSEVDDLAQEVFLRAYQRCSSFREGAPFLPWLKGIAHHVWRNRSRKRRAEPSDNLAEWVQERAGRDDEDDDLSEGLEKCLQLLTSAERRLVRSHYGEDVELPRLAARTGRTAHALAVTLFRIRARLRECLRGRSGA